MMRRMMLAGVGTLAFLALAGVPRASTRLHCRRICQNFKCRK